MRLLLLHESQPIVLVIVNWDEHVIGISDWSLINSVSATESHDLTRLNDFVIGKETFLSRELF